MGEIAIIHCLRQIRLDQKVQDDMKSPNMSYARQGGKNSDPATNTIRLYQLRRIIERALQYIKSTSTMEMLSVLFLFTAIHKRTRQITSNEYFEANFMIIFIHALGLITSHKPSVAITINRLSLPNSSLLHINIIIFSYRTNGTLSTTFALKPSIPSFSLRSEGYRHFRSQIWLNLKPKSPRDLATSNSPFT